MIRVRASKVHQTASSSSSGTEEEEEETHLEQVNSPVPVKTLGWKQTLWSPPSGVHLATLCCEHQRRVAAVRTAAGSGPPSGSGRRDTLPPRPAAAGRSRTGGGAASRRLSKRVRRLKPGDTA